MLTSYVAPNLQQKCESYTLRNELCKDKLNVTDIYDGIKTVFDNFQCAVGLYQNKFVGDCIFDLAIQMFSGGTPDSECQQVAVHDPETFVPWARKLVGNPSASFAGRCTEKMVVDEVLSMLSKHDKQAKLQGYETIKKPHLDHRLFDIETNGILTSTSKLKRMQARNHYQNEIYQMYLGVQMAYVFMQFTSKQIV
ncbi:hypothetical protein DL89DRAFT_300352 [Linderina pennispora]|uniref:Uncharacterized protein n=1 Tax=Linderina pennispora TaxID=61395 RepID=A0A1Y1WLF5_9FUNG|nr:uncharacterized protein DL89DRAFT_300352 [Linderina pennispora]ORX74333.1 hypothetical protein DL89DRAFT_300352 [Linderina pennispora]